MRPIDADELKVKVEAMVTHKFSESDYECGRNQAFDYVADILIDEAPTIEPIEDTKSCGVSADTSAEQNVADVPSGDLISREEVHKVLSLLATEGGKDAKLLFSDAHEFIDALPSADRPTENFCRDCPIYSADRPQVNSAEWVAEKEKEFEELNRPKGECDDKPEPYVPEASTERVVHCKDCIYSRQPEEELFVCENRFGMSGWVRENEFCSSGSL